jgi:hypothetical protein
VGEWVGGFSRLCWMMFDICWFCATRTSVWHAPQNACGNLYLLALGQTLSEFEQHMVIHEGCLSFTFSVVSEGKFERSLKEHQDFAALVRTVNILLSEFLLL